MIRLLPDPNRDIPAFPEKSFQRDHPGKKKFEGQDQNQAVQERDQDPGEKDAARLKQVLLSVGPEGMESQSDMKSQCDPHGQEEIFMGGTCLPLQAKEGIE